MKGGINMEESRYGEFRNEFDANILSFEDSRSISENYIADPDLELFCEELGKLRSSSWAVI